ncbi:hypothetical protein BJV78DRAFT_1116611 [Lactifluus subvellereus]|nr:hypothetical protein BJV78DRAFT_1116611 [Lactifluus subvellereus]
MSDDSSTPQELVPPDRKPNERLYSLSEEERAFLKEQTGIQDDDELKAHVLRLQAEAYKVFPYPCIQRFNFARPKISRLPPYQDLLKLGRERNGAIFLDIGSCFGTDVRKAIADGYPMENVITSDLCQDYADLGHKFFRTTRETYPVAFLPGDVFDPKHLEVVPPYTSANASTGPALALRSLTSLNPLHGRVSAIHVSSFFHLFNEEKQLHVGRALAGLLSPGPGSMIFGRHAALPEKGSRQSEREGHRMFCHSPASWTNLWDGQVFEKGLVKVQTDLLEIPFDVNRLPMRYSTILIWSVVRL